MSNECMYLPTIRECPFCGGTELFVGTIAECEMQDESHPDYYSNSRIYTVVCDYMNGGCGASIGGGCKSEKEAIAAWNRRAGESNE